MPNKLDDDELIRLTSESERFSDRLDQLYEREAEHKSVLAKWDDVNEEMVQNISDITKKLNRAVKELQSQVQERAELTDKLNNFPKEIEQTKDQLRVVQQEIKDGVGPEVCPHCGSTEITTIVYGYPVTPPEDDHSEPKLLMGGCHINPDETVGCLNCGERFPDNFERWKRAKMPRGSETVFEVGLDGGSISIVRERNQYGTWEYRSLRNEMIFSDVLDEGITRDDLFEKSDHEDSFQNALLRLGRYKWFDWYPVKVHPDFADLVLREVMECGGRKAAVKWTETLKHNSFED